MRGVTDEVLVKQILAGGDDGERSFEILADRYRNRFIGYAFRMLRKDRALAEDATQEALLVVHQNLHRFEGKSKVSTFLFGILRNVCLGINKKESGSLIRKNVVEIGTLGDLDRLVIDSGPSFVEQVCVRERLSYVKKAIAELPAFDRDILLWGAIKGVPYVEIAEHFGVSTSVIKSRIKRSREILKKME